MSKSIEPEKTFSQLRRKLDEAITYGEFIRAEKLAAAGLSRAEKKGLTGEAEYFKGELAILNEDYAAAIDHFDRAISDNHSDGAAYNDRALCMVELGLIDESLFYFDKGIEVEPDYATVRHNKGWLLNKIGRHREAIKYFREALELEPERAVTYENLADAYYNCQEYTLALEAYRSALRFLKKRKPDIRKQIQAQIKIIELEKSC